MEVIDTFDVYLLALLSTTVMIIIIIFKSSPVLSNLDCRVFTNRKLST